MAALLSRWVGSCALLGLSLVVGCVGSGDEVCTPGQSFACACANGLSGAQTCKGDGTGFDSCDCGGGLSGAGASTSIGGSSSTGAGPHTGGSVGSGGATGAKDAAVLSACPWIGESCGRLSHYRETGSACGPLCSGTQVTPECSVILAQDNGCEDVDCAVCRYTSATDIRCVELFMPAGQGGRVYSSFEYVTCGRTNYATRALCMPAGAAEDMAACVDEFEQSIIDQLTPASSDGGP